MFEGRQEKTKKSRPRAKGEGWAGRTSQEATRGAKRGDEGRPRGLACTGPSGVLGPGAARRLTSELQHEAGTRPLEPTDYRLVPQSLEDWYPRSLLLTILRKSLIVRKSGSSLPTMARKARLRWQAAATLRLEQTPTE